MANPIFNLHSTRTDLRAAVTKLIALIPKLAPDARFVVDSATMTGPEYVERLQHILELMQNTDEAHARLHDATAAEEAMRVTVRNGANGLKGYTLGTFGESSTQYTDLGFVAKPRVTTSTEKKALAAEKRRATRVMRHTMGTRQRADVLGTVDAPAAVLAPVPAMPAQGANPSPSAPPATDPTAAGSSGNKAA